MSNSNHNSLYKNVQERTHLGPKGPGTAETGENEETVAIKQKPAREIYKPPSLRKSRSGHHQGHHPRQLFHGPPGNHVTIKDRGPPLNVNAKEFHLREQEVFPLVQSKSSGSMFTQFQKYCRQEEELGHGAGQSGESAPGVNQSGGPTSPPPLTNQEQTKRNLGLGKPHVRFLDLDNRVTVTEAAVPLESQLKSLKIEASNNGGWKPQLVKSKSMLTRNPFEYTRSGRELWEAFPNGRSDWSATTTRSDWPTQRPNHHHGIRRSKSFGKDTTFVVPPPRFSEEPSWDNFQMDRWPKGVTESVKVALTGLVERVPARHKIDMVTRIFGTLLGDYEVTLTPDHGHGSLDNFILPAVHIFLYFIQRESDETVLESFLNNCLATYQFLGSNFNNGKPKSGLLLISCSTTSKWITFLKLVSSFYQKTKIIRQTRTVEELRHRLLSLLCDSCLVVLGMSPLSYTVDLVDTLFLVMTSLGRDMETTFPGKMKSILAGVRDVLVGVGTRSSCQGLSPAVHKTLMQLIELHAANWQLPASAVRYYYAAQN